MRKIPFAGIELTSQRVRGLRGTSELPGRPAYTIKPLLYKEGRYVLRINYVLHNGFVFVFVWCPCMVTINNNNVSVQHNNIITEGFSPALYC